MENIHTGTLSPLCLDMRAYLRLYSQIAQIRTLIPVREIRLQKMRFFALLHSLKISGSKKLKSDLVATLKLQHFTRFFGGCDF
jgi:cell division FtsZ-interacting protein ZapD